MSLISPQHTASLLFELGIDNDNINNRSDESVEYAPSQLAPHSQSGQLIVSASVSEWGEDYTSWEVTASSATGSLNHRQSLAQKAEFAFFKSEFIKANGNRFNKNRGFEIKNEDVDLVDPAAVAKMVSDFEFDGHAYLREVLYHISQSDTINKGEPDSWIDGWEFIHR